MSIRSRYGQAGTVDVIVIGAGHAGLAMSHTLSLRSIDHRVIERGEIANAWATERWDSLRLLTPNWMSRLPGHGYDGEDPDGYMTAADVAEFIRRYAVKTSAPVQTRTTVQCVEHASEGYRVATDRGVYMCRALVLASGAFNVPTVPQLATQAPQGVAKVSARAYRNPGQLERGPVLVVGASATGLQLALEIHRSGRAVTLAVGEHVRMPRTYRGRDVQWWMHASGVLEHRIEDTDDPQRARRVPSPQLIGTPERATLDLNALRADGVEIVGRLAGIRDNKALFSGSLSNVCALADLKMNRLLDGFDAWAVTNGIDAAVGPVERYAPTTVGPAPRLGISLGDEIRTIVWATGFRPDYSWLAAPVFDRRGNLQHDRGIVAAPGLYVLGLPYLRRRKSSFIHGAADDVREIGAHLADYLDRTARHTAIPGAPRHRWRPDGRVKVTAGESARHAG